MAISSYISPLRYPGGKSKLTGYIRQVIYSNDLQGGVYIEPFAGGASVALGLLFNGDVDSVVINDKDISIYAFWHSVLYQTEDLCHMIRDVNVNVTEWKKQKDIQYNKNDCDLLTLGFSTFFLNRTNRSGILKGGVIGGYSQNGKFKIDARFNKEDLIKRIIRISEYADKISIHNLDAVDLINNILLDYKERSLIYFDPPYYIKGKGLYLNYYQDSDHIKIAELVCNIQGYKWIISYDNVPFISDLYKKFRTSVFELNYCAGHIGKGQEIMIYSNDMIIPDAKIISTRR